MKWLVDSSVWIDHLRRRNARLVGLLADEAVLMHPAIVGELACGNLLRRTRVLESLLLLPRAQEAGFEELLAFVEDHRLYGRGIGWVDAQLLASASLSGARLWTLDKKLARFAEQS